MHGISYDISQKCYLTNHPDYSTNLIHMGPCLASLHCYDSHTHTHIHGCPISLSLCQASILTITCWIFGLVNRDTHSRRVNVCGCFIMSGCRKQDGVMVNIISCLIHLLLLFSCDNFAIFCMNLVLEFETWCCLVIAVELSKQTWLDNIVLHFQVLVVYSSDFISHSYFHSYYFLKMKENVNFLAE